MPYTADIAGIPLYDPANGLTLSGAKVTQELNKVGAFDFTIYPNHPAYPYLNKLADIVTVKDGSRVVFRGRILNSEEGFKKELKVECESDLAFLLDSRQRPYDYTGTLRGYLEQLVSNHNSLVDDYKQFTVGNVTVVDNNDYIHYSSTQYPTTWDEINDKLVKTHGGYLNVRYSGSTVYLDYLADFTELSPQPVQFGLNMLDFARKVKGEDIATVLIPLGAKLTGEDGQETGERLTIEDVNDGKDYLYDPDAVEAYGWIESTQQWDDVTQASNLKTKGAQALAEKILLGTELELSAVDLAGLGYDYGSFRLGTYVKVDSEPNDLSASFLCSKLSIDLNSPKNSKLSLGATGSTLSDIIHGDMPTTDKVESIVGDYVQGATVNISQMVQTLIQQSESQITTQVIQQTQTIVTSAVDGLEIGGRNLVKNSDFSDGLELWEAAASSVKQDATFEQYLDTVSATGYPASATDIVATTEDNFTYEAGQRYTLSFWAKSTNGETLRIGTGGTSELTQAIGTGWQRYKLTFTPEEAGALSFYLNTAGDFQLAEIKLEKGGKATDWTPAPEDALDAIGDLSDSVDETVADMREDIDEAATTASGAVESVNQVYEITTENETRISEMMQTIDGFEFNFQTLQETVTELNGTVTTEYSERLKYIKFIDGEIWLGKEAGTGEDDFKVVISNERIRFLQNGVEVAYISNQQLYITNARILTRLEIGNFAFYPRENGNMTLRYTGEG